MTPLLCDVCMAQRAELWGFRVAAFHIPNWTNVAGEWGVCDECCALIVRRQPVALAGRIICDPDTFTLRQQFFTALLTHIETSFVRFTDPDTPLVYE